MAKISKHPIEPIIDTSDRWKQTCLIGDGSLFSNSQLWTLANVNQFKNYFVDNLIYGGEQSFYDKFKIQLANAPAEVKQLSAEMLYILLLFPSNITASKKANDIRLVWDWSGQSLDEVFPFLEESLAKGVGSTGMAYNNLRWAEFVFFTTWLSALKALPVPERQRLLSDPWLFGNWLDKTEGADKRQLRHIVLFLLFSDYFETSSSRNQKNKMLTSFQSKVGAGSPLIAKNDSDWIKKDKNILFVRDQLTEEAGEPINFYLSPYKELWLTEGVSEVTETKNASEQVLAEALVNQILYGPPGTGKTYFTVIEALKILEGIDYDPDLEYSEQKTLYDGYKAKGQIGFVTFHQSFSYEDFVEGIRAETNNEGNLSYAVKDGIFKKLAIEALFSKYETQNLTDEKSINDVWLTVKDNQQKEMDFDAQNYEHKKLLLSAPNRPAFLKGTGKPYILIIDEINRGNTSRIFGELITLIESTKRAGSDEAMDAVLPYSQEIFTVPNNLYIIGTMNTADRSLALIDTALRRRFDFIEKMPDVTLIKNKKTKNSLEIEGVNIQEMLQAINDRIEALYDREHTIGHAFFMKLGDDSTITDLASVFRRNILPLLEEYFFEDWNKICQVLGKSGIYEVKNFKEPGLSTANNYSRKEKLLAIPETYINIYKDTDSTQQDSTGSS